MRLAIGLESRLTMSALAQPTQPSGSARAWHAAVLEEERAGELLNAFDLAQRGLEQHPQDVWLKHRAVLALARTGATAEAHRRLALSGLVDSQDEDVAALRARIAKDVALAAEGQERRQLATIAAELYGDISARTDTYYTAINAATLWLVAGDLDRARLLAAHALELAAGDREETYYAAATEGEAKLLLGDEVGARAAVERAVRLHGGDYGALATTRRQLRTVCELVSADTRMLKLLAGPAVVHFCGHRLAGPAEAGSFEDSAERAVAGRIAELLKCHRVGYAYGSLASGADILWAEALLAAGSEVHIVLPFARAQFIERSVAPAGAAWTARFEKCIAAVKSVRYVTAETSLGDDVLFRYASQLAMGLTLLQARYLAVEARQLAVWNEAPASGHAGTATDTAIWQRAGQQVTVIPPDGEPPTQRVPLPSVSESAREPAVCMPPACPPDGRASIARTDRVVVAMVYGDFMGFSRLTDEQMPIFTDTILGAFAKVLQRYRDSVWYRNTWGDALCVVLSDVVCAAECALELQHVLSQIDLEACGLPAHLALRLGLHLGPVFRVYDPVLEGGAFTGSHVSRTARLEPVTPPGAVYVTEAFAGALMLASRDEFGCDYVGHMPAAKNYGRLRMYRLWRRSSAEITGNAQTAEVDLSNGGE